MGSMGIIWWAAGLVGMWLSRDRSGRPRRNLIPAIVILLTGWAMSAHPQTLELSTHVHSVFGYTLMAAGLTRLIEISFVLRDKVAPKNPDDIDEEINSFQFLPPFLLYASGFLFMSMLLHLYSYYTASSSKGKGPSKRHDEEHS